MTFMSWRKDYELGVAQIDAEHHVLFDLVNEFHDTLNRGGSHGEIFHVLNRLISYAEAHFQHEEQLMSEINYPLLEKHQQQHSDLVASIFSINERLPADPAKGSADLLKFVKHWLVDHIVKDDLDIAEFIRRTARQRENNPPASASEAT